MIEAGEEGRYCMLRLLDFAFFDGFARLYRV